MKIKMVVENGQVKVTSPYNAEFVSKSRNLQGKFLAGQWVFPENIIEHVRNAMIECYGVTGETDYDTCILTVKDYSESIYTDGIELFGRSICKAYGRDSGAKLSEGIILIKGKMRSGGSVKNWQTCIENATFEIHDFPVAALDFAFVKEGISSGWVEVKKNGRTKEDILAEIERYKKIIIELESQL